MNIVQTAATLMKDGLVELGALLSVEHSPALPRVQPGGALERPAADAARRGVPAQPGRFARRSPGRRRGTAYGPWQRVTRRGLD